MSSFNLDGCKAGDIASSSSNSAVDNSNTDNSQNGISECTALCQPVDVANCNQSSSDSPVINCFVQSFDCKGSSGQPDGPNFVSTLPSNCVLVQPEPSPTPSA